MRRPCRPNEPSSVSDEICLHPSKGKLSCKDCGEYNAQLPQTAKKACENRELFGSKSYREKRHDNYIKWLMNYMQNSDPQPHLYPIQKSALLQSISTGGIDPFCESMIKDVSLQSEDVLYSQDCLSSLMSSDDADTILESLSLCYEKKDTDLAKTDFELIKVFLRCARAYPILRIRVARTLKALVMEDDLSDIDVVFTVSTVLDLSENFVSGLKLLIDRDLLSSHSPFHLDLVNRAVKVMPDLNDDESSLYAEALKTVLMNRLDEFRIPSKYLGILGLS